MDTGTNNFYFQEDDSHVDIKHEVKKYLRYWPWFILAITLTLSIAYAYLRYSPRIYKTSTKIKILDDSDGLELPTSAFIFKRSNINLENEIEILTSYTIIEKVVRKLGYTDVKDFQREYKRINKVVRTATSAVSLLFDNVLFLIIGKKKSKSSEKKQTEDDLKRINNYH